MEEDRAGIYNVLIIGAGQIGAFFDRPGDSQVLTHAHAFTLHPGFNLLGFADSNPVQAQKAAAIWGGEAFRDWKEAWQKHVVDVVCLAVPDDYHYIFLKDLAGKNSRIVFAEKPLVQTISEAEEIRNLYAASPVALQVNYTRRFVPEIIKLSEQVKQGRYGKLISGNAYYGKGLLHNGSHLLDLLTAMLGEIKEATVMTAVEDYYKDDPTLSAVLEYEGGGRICIQAADCRAYTVFEIDLLFEKKRIRLVEAGFRIEEYDISENPLFAGYRNLVLKRETATTLDKSLYYAASNIYEYLQWGWPLLCTLEDGCRVVQLCQELKAAKTINRGCWEDYQ